MTRKGEAPNDYRSEAERIRARAEDPSFDQEYSSQGRAPERVAPLRGGRYGPEEPRVPDDENPDKTKRQAIVRLLAMDPEFASSEIVVEVQKSEVLLRGSVDTMNTKYRAEEISKRVAGVAAVNNQLSVRVGGAMDEFTRGSAVTRLHDESIRGKQWR
jgi:hypothetical protein